MLKLIFFKDEKEVPALEFFEQIPKKASAKAEVRLERLVELGHNLRRPESDFLRDGIYELRWQLQSTQYRLLYFFHGQEIVVLSHGIVKNDWAVPPKQIDLAIRRKALFESNPEKHSYYEDQEEET